MAKNKRTIPVVCLFNYLNLELKNLIKAYTNNIKVSICKPIAISENFFSKSLANNPIPKLIRINTIGEVLLKKDRNLFINYSIYLKKLSTNSYLLKTCKSSIPSPTPIYLTGI